MTENSASRNMIYLDQAATSLPKAEGVGEAMRRYIDEVCARGSTLIRARGSYTTTDRQVLLCACSKAEAYKVRRAAHQTDPDAFVMITETSEVFGEGFIDPTDNVKIQ